MKNCTRWASWRYFPSRGSTVISARFWVPATPTLTHVVTQVRVVYCQIKTCSSSGTTYVALPEAVFDGNTWLLTLEQVLLNPSCVERPHTKNDITPLFLVSVCPEVNKFPPKYRNHSKFSEQEGWHEASSSLTKPQYKIYFFGQPDTQNLYIPVCLSVHSVFYILSSSVIGSRDSSVGIGTRYGLDGPGIESR